MEETEARTILRTMIRVMAILDDSLHALERRMDEASFATYKAQAASIMGNVVLDVLAPIYNQYPQLEARDANEWFLAGALGQPNWLTGNTDTGAES